MSHFIILFSFNLLVAVWGAWAAGKICLQTKQSPWIGFTMWATLISAAASFTFVYFMGGVKIAMLAHFIPNDYIRLTHKIVKNMLIFPLFTSSLILTLESWNFFWKKKNLGNLSAISISTYTQIQNLITLENAYEAADFSWDIISGADIAFEGAVALVLFAISIGIGVMTTWIIFKYAKQAKHQWLRDKLNYIKSKIILDKKELA